jgi:PAS domain S-box-containing protein
MESRSTSAVLPEASPAAVSASQRVLPPSAPTQAQAVEAAFRVLFEGSLEGVILTDESGRITAWNHAAEAMFGWRQEEAVGRSLAAMLVPPRLRGDDEAAMSWFQASGDTDVLGVVAAPAAHRDGHELDVELAMSPPFRFQAGIRLVAFVRDVTRRRQAERIQLAQLAVGRVLSAAAGPEDACRDVLREAGEKLDLAAARLLVRDGSGQLVVGQLWSATAELADRRRARRLSREDRALAERVWASGRPERVRSSAALSSFIVPVSDGSRVVALLQLCERRPAGPEDEALVASVAELGRQLGEFLRRQQAEAELREMFDHSPVGLARVGLDGSILTANRTFAGLVGIDLEEVAGRRLREIIAPAELGAAHRAYEALAAGERDSIELDERCRRPDGRSFWCHLDASAVRRAGSGARYFVVTVQDIESRKQAESMQRTALEAQQQAIQELERLGRLKSDFVSVVSHEFRTALMGIQGFSELMCGSDVPAAEMRSYAADINSDARRLGRLINDMLDLDRIESGRVRLSPESLDLDELVREAVGRARVLSSAHRFRVELGELAPVEADRDRLTQVLGNLLGNAVKYSPEGGEIEVRTSSDGSTVRVSVRDHGLGIPAAALEQVFERFSRIEQAGAPRVGGTGLGLPIVRQIVELHGGRVWAENELQGISFHFTIPLPARGGAGEQAKGEAQHG